MVLSSLLAAKYRGLSEGDRGAAPLSADNTPHENPFIMVPMPLQNRCVTVRVDGVDAWDSSPTREIIVTTVTHRHASSEIRSR